MDVYSETFSAKHGLSNGKHELCFRLDFCDSLFARDRCMESVGWSCTDNDRLRFRSQVVFTKI